MRIAQQTTQQWKAVAERAQAEVKATQSQETADLLAALEVNTLVMRSAAETEGLQVSV